jgi:hypothetical protein
MGRYAAGMILTEGNAADRGEEAMLLERIP